MTPTSSFLGFKKGYFYLLLTIAYAGMATQLPAQTSVSAPSQTALALRLARVFSDGVVLQREKPVPIWGWAIPGSTVTVEFAGAARSVSAGADGRWQVVFGPLEASFEPREIRVTTDPVGTPLRVTDVVVGEVWMLAGQSNMEWGLGASDGGPKAASTAHHPWLRLFNPGRQLPDDPAPDLAPNSRWVRCDPATAKTFPALGFWLAAELHARLGVPVGLVRTAVSGTYGESWVPREVLEAIPVARPRLQEYEIALRRFPAEHERWTREKAAHEAVVASALRADTKPPGPDYFVKHGPMGPDHFNRPYALYNGRIAPLAPFALRGVVWYQGEGNTQKNRAPYYGALLDGLFLSWRQAWNEPALPFLLVQLPRFQPGPHNDWPSIRAAQFEAARRDPLVDLVVTIDTGDPQDIHPRDKKPVADRLARLALARVYGRGHVATGPLANAARHHEGSLVVAFDHVGEGLKTTDGAAPKGFELAGADQVFKPAGSAEILGRDQVRLAHPEIPAPAFVRYAWANLPEINLINNEGLPAAPFADAAQP